jgi:hypothetical protein
MLFIGAMDFGKNSQSIARASGGQSVELWGEQVGMRGNAFSYCRLQSQAFPDFDCHLKGEE